MVDVSCRALARLPHYVAEWGMNKPAREVARNLRGYFDDALDFHRSDQEARLFPALLAQVHDADALRALVATFKKEHRVLEGAWGTLRARLNAVALCRPPKLSVDEAAGFAALYRDHKMAETRHLSVFGITVSRGGEYVITDSSRRRSAPYRWRLADVANH